MRINSIAAVLLAAVLGGCGVDDDTIDDLRAMCAMEGITEDCSTVGCEEQAYQACLAREGLL